MVNGTDFETANDGFEIFEWDERKRQRNVEKHGIDFFDAATVFQKPYLRRRSDHDGETRHLAVGLFEDIEITIVYTERPGVCRLISARRARRNERVAYYKSIGN